MVCPASHVATNRGRNIDAAQHKEQHSTCLQFVLDATKRNVHQETKVPRRRWAAENTPAMRPLWERAPQLAGKVHDKQHASQTTTALGASMVCPASHVATNRSRNIDAAQHKEQHSTCLQFVLDATKRNVHQETKVPRRRWAAENTQPCVLYGNVHPNLQGKCTTSSTHHKPQLRLVHPWFALLAT